MEGQNERILILRKEYAHLFNEKGATFKETVRKELRRNSGCLVDDDGKPILESGVTIQPLRDEDQVTQKALPVDEDMNAELERLRERGQKTFEALNKLSRDIADTVDKQKEIGQKIIG